MLFSGNFVKRPGQVSALMAAAIFTAGCATAAPPSSLDAASIEALQDQQPTSAADGTKAQPGADGRRLPSGTTDPSAESSTRPARGAPSDIPIQPAGARPADELPRPTSLSVAGTGIDVDIVRVGVTRNNAMQIPEDFHKAGWYKHGPAPGASQGHAVIAGHVDSMTEVMPFAGLDDVQPGTVVTVGMQNAAPLRYRVTNVRHIPKATLGGTGIFARDGPHRLKVITCGGDWLPDREDYEDNVVLTAAPL
jgi:hypothetical protein